MFSIKTPKGMRKIGPGQPTFIVAEMSGNHGQKLERAKDIIRAAAEAGADAVKLQTYTADTMTIDCNNEWFRVGGEDNPEKWQGKTLYQLYQNAFTPWEWHAELKSEAERLGLTFFSTPFDATAVDFLENLNVPCYKIASYEVTDIPLLKAVAKTKKPVILSIGYATIEEVDEAIMTLRNSGAPAIAVLHCVTSYAENTPEVLNFRTIADIAERYQVVSGFSDNNGGIEAPAAAALLGAGIIEKHVVYDHADESSDARFSVDRHELKAMVEAIRHAEGMLGNIHYGPHTEQEAYNRRFRRSLFVVKDIAAGEIFSSENIRVIRPAFGLPPREFDNVLGKKAAQAIKRGTPLQRELIS